MTLSGDRRRDGFDIFDLEYEVKYLKDHPDAEEMLCGDKNVNVCVAEGCYAKVCLKEKNNGQAKEDGSR